MRIRWTDELVEAGIMEVVDHIGEQRMPTAPEIQNYYNNRALLSQIYRRGGLIEWANKLGLPTKTTAVTLGWGYEKYTKGRLEGEGYQIISCPKNSPYDLLVNGRVKLEVKASHLIDFGSNVGYTFDVAKDTPKSDIYILYCLDDNDEIVKTYVIPAHVLYGKQQITIGQHKSKRDKYINRWDLIDKLIDSFSALEVA